MSRLTVVMIVKNEADCLGDCLASVRGIADRILIGDTGSTDGTIALAQGFGARVIPVTWNDDFAEARNAVLAEARGSWLLHMDADEVLDPDSAVAIRRIVKEDGAGRDAYEVTLYNYCDDPRAWRWVPAEAGNPWARGRAGYLPVPLLRLFRNHCGFHYREAVHENITASVLERGGKIGQSDAVIHHYGYESSPEQARQKAGRYLAIARKKAAANPRDTKALQDLAELAVGCGETAEAEAACRAALELEPEHVPCATTLANLLLNRGDFVEARQLLERFEALPSPAPHLLMALGALDCREGKLEEARRRIEAALRGNPRSGMARLCLARVYDQLGDIRRAESELRVAHETAPGIREFADRLRAHALRQDGERLFQAGFSEEALEILVEALHLDGEDPLLHNDIGVVAHALGDAGRARTSFMRALQLAPALGEARENLASLG